MPHTDDKTDLGEPSNGGCQTRSDCAGLMALTELVAGLEGKVTGCSTEIGEAKTVLGAVQKEQTAQGLDISATKVGMEKLTKLFQHGDSEELSLEAIKSRTSLGTAAFDFFKVAIKAPATIILALVALVIAIPSELAISVSWQHGLLIGSPDVVANVGVGQANGSSRNQNEPKDDAPAVSPPDAVKPDSIEETRETAPPEVPT